MRHGTRKRDRFGKRTRKRGAIKHGGRRKKVGRSAMMQMDQGRY